MARMVTACRSWFDEPSNQRLPGCAGFSLFIISNATGRRSAGDAGCILPGRRRVGPHGFGQKIPIALINYPPLGFFNFQHSGDTWPSYPGPNPIAAMVRDGRKHLVLTIHKLSDVIDGGEFVAHSHRGGGFLTLQFAEGFIYADERAVVRLGRHVHPLQKHSRQLLAVPEMVLAPAIVNEDAAHGFGGGAQEMSATALLLPRGFIQTQLGLVDQGRRLERSAGLLVDHSRRSESAQFLVNQRQQFIEGLCIACFDGSEQLGNAGHRLSLCVGTAESESFGGTSVEPHGKKPALSILFCFHDRFHDLEEKWGVDEGKWDRR